MNAYELADELQELDSKLHLIELFKAATMLRQQQAEIEALKKELALQRLSDIGQAQEPVVWMHTNSKQLFATTKPSKRDLHLFTPLYIYPICELTDEEIEGVAKPYCDLQNWVVDKHEFARAILRKASEK